MACCCCWRMSSTVRRGSSSAVLADAVCRNHGSSSNGFELWVNNDDLEQNRTWRHEREHQFKSILDRRDCEHSFRTLLYFDQSIVTHLSCVFWDSELFLKATSNCFSLVTSSSINVWRRSPSRLVLKSAKLWLKQENCRLLARRELKRTLVGSCSVASGFGAVWKHRKKTASTRFEHLLISLKKYPILNRNEGTTQKIMLDLKQEKVR